MLNVLLMGVVPVRHNRTGTAQDDLKQTGPARRGTGGDPGGEGGRRGKGTNLTHRAHCKTQWHRRAMSERCVVRGCGDGGEAGSAGGIDDEKDNGMGEVDAQSPGAGAGAGLLRCPRDGNRWESGGELERLGACAPHQAEHGLDAQGFVDRPSMRNLAVQLKNGPRRLRCLLRCRARQPGRAWMRESEAGDAV